MLSVQVILFESVTLKCPNLRFDSTNRLAVVSLCTNGPSSVFLFGFFKRVFCKELSSVLFLVIFLVFFFVFLSYCVRSKCDVLFLIIMNSLLSAFYVLLCTFMCNCKFFSPVSVQIDPVYAFQG
jgi:hypothetical protein